MISMNRVCLSLIKAGLGLSEAGIFCGCLGFLGLAYL